jgi:hypothetical protein
VELITPERLAPEGSAPTEAAARPRDREAAIAAMRQRVYPLLERVIAAHPEQWVSALATVWDFPPSPARGAERVETNDDERKQTPASAQRTPAKSVAGENR